MKRMYDLLFKMSYVINDNLLKCLYFYTGCKELKYNKKQKQRKTKQAQMVR